MKTLTRIQSVSPGHTTRLLETLTIAFQADPVARWIFPDDDDYRRVFPRFASAFGGRAFDHGSAFASDDLAGVALWLPPGVEPDEERLGRILDRWLRPDRLVEVAYMLVQMEHHHPREPHWYLPLLGVSPERRNEGLGSALLHVVLERCDREGLPAYLESPNPANLTLYRRHGFRQTGEIRTAGSPPLFPMFREPR